MNSMLNFVVFAGLHAPPLIPTIVVLALIAIGMWAVNKFGAQIMHPWWLNLLNIVAMVGTVVWLLSQFGVLDYLSGSGI